jgi:xanthine dehydrogenase accessory factor
MGFELDQLRALTAKHGQVARVVIAQVAGSSPREVGAAMLVWPGGQSGTIGGGALEYQAAQQAFIRNGLTRHALGPELGQCCGGAVTLLTEQFRAQDLEGIAAPYARGPGEMPLAVHRLLDRARARGEEITPQLLQGWMVEPVEAPHIPLWIWGAGHVGRALIHTLSPLPEYDITWVDTAPDRFPDTVPDNVTCVPAAEPSTLMAHAPQTAQHLILTYSHEIDFALCHAALNRGFAFAGVIGSDTKWARFRKRLRSLGHSDQEIDRITCPIGRKDLGKQPQAIAIGVAGQLLTQKNGGQDGCKTHFLASRA